MKSTPTSFERHGWMLACLIPVVSALLVRGPMPIDETRYLSVAWEMWSKRDFILPALNGMAYTHKPPLLFWLINLGWGLFGVNAWWPRLIPLMAAIASVWLVRHLAVRLFPKSEHLVPETVAWLLAGSLAWTLFSTILLFDLVLTVCVLVAIVGLVRVEDAPVKGWLLFAGGIAAGLLTKGPATLVFTLGPALFGPYWSRSAKERPWRWYGGLVAALIVALGAPGLWVSLAYEEAGRAFVHTILWDQSATRVVHSFAHARPWWFYLAVFPPLLLPWLAWPTMWRVLRLPNQRCADRLVLSTVIPSFVVFSLISGKQPHYLLSLVPMVALGLGPRLARADVAFVSTRAPAFVFIAIGVAFALFSDWNHRHVAALSVGAAIVFGGGMMLRRSDDRHAAIRHLALSNAATIAMVTIAFFASVGETYELTGTAAEVRRLDEQRVPIAWLGAYSGQLNFLARLQEPVTELEPSQPEAIAEWTATHPEGQIIVYSRGELAMDPGFAIHRQPYHSGWLSIVPVGAPQLAQYFDSKSDATEPSLGD